MNRPTFVSGMLYVVAASCVGCSTGAAKPIATQTVSGGTGGAPSTAGSSAGGSAQGGVAQGGSTAAGGLTAMAGTVNAGGSATLESAYANRSPLAESKFAKLPLGSVKPKGWLERALRVQAAGLTGHIDEFWDPIVSSGWKGDTGQHMTGTYDVEFVPNYLEGLVPLAYLLDDQDLIDKAQKFLDFILSQTSLEAITVDTLSWLYIGRMLREYYEISGDPRVLTLLRTAISDIAQNGVQHEAGNIWGDSRIGGVTAFAYWLYNQTGDQTILSDTEKIAAAQIATWSSTLSSDPLPGVHGVDLSEALKIPALFALQSGDAALGASVVKALLTLDRDHGQMSGRFNADEFLTGLAPTQGTELCTVVEHLHSLEHILATNGDLNLGDRMEELAYNAKPGALTADMWARQYDQQANQVLVSIDARPWHGNGNDANLYGLNPNYPCCLGNFGQGWPRFVQHLWMATPEGELVAMAYGPNQVEVPLSGGGTFGVLVDTDYPFDGSIKFAIKASAPTTTTLHFRIPAWAEGATLSVAGQAQAVTAGTLVDVQRTFQDGDQLELSFPMEIKTQKRMNDAIAVTRGPLVFALRMGMEWKSLTRHYRGSADWEIRPTTPWNYGLVLDPSAPSASLEVERNPIGSYPFGQKGDMVYDEMSDSFMPWPDDPPVVIKAKGRLLAGWAMNGANAADPPKSPVTSDSPLEDLVLVPYGAARLRVTEIPYILP